MHCSLGKYLVTTLFNNWSEIPRPPLIETLLIEGLKSNTGVQSVLLRRTEIKTGPEARQIIGSVMMLFVVTGFIQDV